jgi:hypothetical protein
MIWYVLSATMITRGPFFFLTNCMEQSPSWEASRSSASQEILCILWNMKVHYHIHKILSPVPTLSQIDPVYVLPLHFSKTHFIIIFWSTAGSSK